MKKYHFILVSSLAFLVLFYDQSIGLNLSIFGLTLIGFICYFFRNKFSENVHYILAILSVFSCFAFAWFGDFVSFLAMFLSIVFLQFKIQNKDLKIIQAIPIVIVNGFASFIRIFQFSYWLPELKTDSDFIKKIIAYLIIPIFFLSFFLMVYSFGSEHFLSIFTNYTLDINPLQFIFMLLLGLFISFNFWNYWIPDYFNEINSKLNDDFTNEISTRNQKTFSFLDIDFERKSGEISLFLLNSLLFVFIITYNYEQFFEVIKARNLSEATHESVNAVILSIVMAVGVIFFYFKSGFNFDENAINLKKLAKIWIFLNATLIISTIVKNGEYISFYGLTYKRLGVFAFLGLSLIGLIYTFLKITNQKSNIYLLNKMIWYFYGTLLLTSFVNWGQIITVYNISVNKGVEPIFLSELEFNDETRRKYFQINNLNGQFSELDKKENILNEKSKTFLSKVLYYEFVP